MYVDKPMKGHGLMQAIARVNRVFRDKPAGLVVDYIGIGHTGKVPAPASAAPLSAFCDGMATLPISKLPPFKMSCNKQKRYRLHG